MLSCSRGQDQQRVEASPSTPRPPPASLSNSNNPSTNTRTYTHIQLQQTRTHPGQSLGPHLPPPRPQLSKPNDHHLVCGVVAPAARSLLCGSSATSCPFTRAPNGGTLVVRPGRRHALYDLNRIDSKQSPSMQPLSSRRSFSLTCFSTYGFSSRSSASQRCTVTNISSSLRSSPMHKTNPGLDVSSFSTVLPCTWFGDNS